jgi:hypothetical protein
MYPVLGPEMAKARVEELRRQAGARAHPGERGKADRSGAWRSTLGARFVSLGLRLLGEPARIERARVR